MNPNIEKLEDKESNAKVDQLISDIAESYISEVGWTDVIDSLKILDKTSPRFQNNKQWDGMEWIGAHLLSVLRDKVYDLALAEGRCPDCGRKLLLMARSASKDNPYYEWLECGVCLEEYPVRG